MSSKILTNILEDIVVNKPDNIAIESVGKLISYQELNNRTNFVANFLISLNIEKGSVITTFLNDKALQIISLIGIFKSGNIYLPFDIKFGQNHWEELLYNIQPNVLLISKEYLDILKSYRFLFNEISTKIIVLESNDSTLSFSELSLDSFDSHKINVEGINHKNPKIYIEDNDSNYIFFTSGTTGRPKAVLGTHISLSHFIHWEIKELEINDSINIAQITSLTFDASLRDIFVALITASILHIPDQITRENPVMLIKWLIEKKINLLHSIPTMLRVIINVREDMGADDTDLADLKYILLAGEKLYVKDIIKWKKLFGTKAVFYNLYGATESTLVKTFYKISDDQSDADQNDSIPVGQPISNTRILILNESGNICKINEKGRVYIKTPFLSKGYYKDSIATARKFIQNPLNEQQDIIYDTGDIGKYDNDRNLIIIGREDGMIKLNGVRVDLNTLENIILKWGEIQMVKFLLHNENSIDNTLVCFYTSKSISENELREFSSKQFSHYEQPSLIFKLEEFPVSVNGKVDIPHLRTIIKERLSILETTVEPTNTNETEKKIIEIWKELLGIQFININSNFFALGGQSIKGIQLLNRIHKEFNINLNLNKIYELATIKELAIHIDKQSSSKFEKIPPIEIKDYYKVSNSQKRMWLSSLKKENRSLYNVPLNFLIKGKIDLLILENSILQLIKKHEVLRTKFKFINGDVHSHVISFEEIDFKLEIISRVDNHEHYISNEGLVPFDLEKDILIRAKSIVVNKIECILLITLNHIIYDGWSRKIIQEEILKNYELLNNKKELIEEPVHTKYNDYVYWHKKKYQEQEVYWAEFFKEDIIRLNFPLDRERPKILSQKGYKKNIVIDIETITTLKIELEKYTIKKTDYFLVIFGILLSEYSKQNQFLIGTIVSGRTHLDLEKIIGVFINYLPLKININEDELLLDTIMGHSKAFMLTYENQDYPYDLLVENFVKFSDNSRNPLFDISIVLHENESNKEFSNPNAFNIDEFIAPSSELYDIAATDFKIDIVFNDTDVSVFLEYNVELFNSETMSKLLDDYVYLLKKSTNMLDFKISKIKEEFKNDGTIVNKIDGDFSELII
jgi:amino acid adenylation domain-containing protein